MRCKNCGAENDEKRYICEICGSPLYDDNEKIENVNSDDYDTEDYNDYEADKKKRNIIIGIIAAVIAVAVIAGTVFAFSSKGGEEPESSSEITTVSTTRETTTKKRVTTESTTKETTTEHTTESTTAPTTKPTTLASYTIAVDIDGNGSVSGDGSYKEGDKAILTAVADEGFQFAGWYDNSTGGLVASGEKYTVTVKKNLNLTAKFEKTEATPEEEQIG